jgi:hypothetical protein
MSRELVFQLIIGLVILGAGGYQAMTGSYVPFQRVDFGAPRSPSGIRVLGGFGVLIGVAVVTLSLAGVSFFHLLGRS